MPSSFPPVAVQCLVDVVNDDISSIGLTGWTTSVVDGIVASVTTRIISGKYISL
jgi:hypothetical protein